MIAGVTESTDGNFWVATNTSPYVAVFKVDRSGQVLESHAWNHGDRGIHAGSALILEVDGAPRVFISDPFNAVVHVLGPERD